MFPYGDQPNPRGFTPWVTWLLIAANVLIYLRITLPLGAVVPAADDPALLAWARALSTELGVDPRALAREVSAYDLFVWEHGFKPGAPAWEDLLSSMFLHGGLLHLLGNMLFLWIYGDNVEHRLGRLGYLVAYLGTGAAAVAGHAAVSGSSLVPMLGASGAISGVLGMYFVMFPRNLVKVFMLLIVPLGPHVGLYPARLVLGLYLILDNVLPLLIQDRGPVAYGAHIGGFVAGAALAWLGERRDWRLRTAPLGDSDDAQDLHALQEAAAAQAPAAAAQALARVHPQTLARLPVEELLTLARQLEQLGLASAAWRVLHERLGQGPPGDEAALLHLGLAGLRLRQHQPAAAWRHLHEAEARAKDPRIAQRARELQAQVLHAGP